ncbi:hypothetical protein HHL17_00495 [Chitinophaga sp. G-6-1-13]|uniref:Uncharacterized protein n=1 Tax=Chitinophaga fulva TaxID=2728842 RepID=A0A848GG07_9BACT|nr:hypothetical protein [Chitinophaga fulva]NML35660.1 hypothetical protein [Chitinophaga fulva]
MRNFWWKTGYLALIPLLIFFIALGIGRGDNLETAGILLGLLVLAYGIVGVMLLMSEDREEGLALLLSGFIMMLVAFITGWFILGI